MAIHDCSITNHESTTIDLNDGSSYQLRTLEGIYTAEVEAVFSHLPATPPAGVILYNNWQRRIIRVEVGVDLNGVSYSDRATNAAAITDALVADSRDHELTIFKYTSPSSTELWIDCVLYRATEVEDSLGNPSAVIFDLLCPDPSFYAATATEYTGNNFSGTSTVEVATTNAGSMPAYPTITYGGTVTNPKVTDGRSRWFQFSDTVESGETLTADFTPYDKSFTHSVDGTWRDKRAVGSRLVQVDPGTSSLDFVGEDAADDGAITVSFRACYPSHR